jgi:hypothetical protein
MERHNMPYKNKADRKYKQAAKYEDSPEQVKHREERNKLRAKFLKEGRVHKGDKKDVAHKLALDKGGSNKQGAFVESEALNRSFKRDAKRNLVSEVSTKEKKKGVKRG